MRDSRIFKYPLSMADRQHLAIRLVKPLTIQKQHDTPTLWAIVNDAAPIVHFDILLVGTGQPFEYLSQSDTHIGTYQDGSFVWHWFLRVQS